MRVRFTPPTQTFGGYIFDCDGTLADSMPLHHDAWKFALKECGAEFEFTWEIFASRGGMPLEQTVRELNQQFCCELDPIAIAAAQRVHFEARLHELQPISEVTHFARQVQAQRPVSVASGNLRLQVVRSLHTIGVGDIFDIIVTPEQVERGKPHPDMFLLAAELMGVRPKDCLVIEDSPLGIQAAERAGMAWALVEDALPTVPKTG
ncbi:MAG: HAD family phosphatase [Polyangiaceae bacterium]|nr:HAD family phosphatase [Polyangiaceae bacterium]